MRYRATGTISWDFETNLPHNQAMEVARKHLSEIPSTDDIKDIRILLQLDKLKDKFEKIKLGEFRLEDVLPFVTKDEEKVEFVVDGKKYFVKMNSSRYFLFKECSHCVACGLQGTRMLLECHPIDKHPHFNLYGEEDSQLILMTKDHIVARACGGEDHPSNYQTMCAVCNSLKGHSSLTLEAVNRIRQVYNQNKNKMTKKNLHALIEKTKLNLEKKEPVSSKKLDFKPKKIYDDAMVACCDIHVYFYKNDLYGKSVYETVPCNYQHIGCISKGSLLEPIVKLEKKVMCKLSEKDFILLDENLLKLQ